MVRCSLAVLSLLVSVVVVAGLAYGQEGPPGPQPGERHDGPPPRERAWGGGGRGFGGEMAPLFLLRLEPVQKELKVTDEQKEKIQKLAEEMRPAPRAEGESRPSRDEMQKKMKERAEKINKTLAEILKADQTERLKQIGLQVQGPRAFENPEVVKALQITDEQKTKVKDILSETRKQVQALGRPDPEATPADRKERLEKVQKIQKEATAKCVEALTPEQKKKFEELRGKPFEIDLSALGGRQRSRRNPAPRERSDW